MNKYLIRLNEDSFCIGFTILDEVADGYIEVSSDIFPQKCGQKFDVETMRWLEEFDESLDIIFPEPPLSEKELIDLENYSNILFLTSMAMVNV